MVNSESDLLAGSRFTIHYLLFTIHDSLDLLGKLPTNFWLL